jgi:protein subunit release factor B
MHFGASPYAIRSRLNLAAAAFETTSHAFKKAMAPRPTLPDSDLHHVYLKGSGPGGQKINKTNSACQLTHIPTGIVVKSQATRSRSQNHNIARRILAEKIELLEKGEDSRVAIKTAAASKKKASKRKKALRKYRKLGEAKEIDEDVESGLEGEDALEKGALVAEDRQGGDGNLLEVPRTVSGSAEKPGNMRFN